MLFINTILSLIAAVMLTANWQMNKHVTGTKDWAITQWLWAFGILLYLPRGIWPDWASIILANALLVIGSFFFLRGVCKYQSAKKLPLWFECLAVIIMIIGYTVFTYVHFNLGARVVLLSAYGFLIMMAGLKILWPLIKTSGGVGIVVCAGVFIHALFFLSRVIFTLMTDNDKSLLEGGNGAVWMLTEAIAFIFWSTLSFALLTNLRLQNDLKLLAYSDPLTNLLNRRAMFEECRNGVLSGETKSAGILVLDLDHFKSINDNYGHATGDKVLKHFANLVSKLLPPKASFSRAGGEEFIIILPNITKAYAEEQSLMICEKIRNALIIVDEKEIKFTVSIGIAHNVVQHSGDLSEMINDADKAMYIAKKNGRDQSHFYQKSSTLTSLSS